MSVIRSEALAQLMIHLAALIVWHLTGKDKQAYQSVVDQGRVFWEEHRYE